ncbi:hypothetical protein OROHE_000336 [Orobanche hederae]
MSMVLLEAIWNSLQTLIFEGNSYDIENFVIAEAKGTPRLVSSNMSTLLSSSPIVQHVPLEDVEPVRAVNTVLFGGSYVCFNLYSGG